MKKNFVFVFIIISLVSCNNKQSQVNDNSVDTITIAADTTTLIEKDTDDIANIELDEEYIQNFSYKGINIFEPRVYESTDFTKQLLHIMQPLAGLFHKGNKYELKECKIVKNNVYEDECSGSTMLEPTLDIKGNCLYLIKGLKSFDKNVLDTVPANIKVWLNKTHSFTFNNTGYQFRSEGKLISKNGSGDEYYENIRDYKLYLSTGDKTQCIVQMKYFADTMTEILFIGDLDKDGKPDLIISSPDHYESNRLLLFLSSYAGSNEIVKLVSITADSFAC